VHFKEDAEYRKRLAVGFLNEARLMTDYGDESTRTDPWSLFDKEDAKEALGMAEHCYSLADEIYRAYTN